jgi:hypothetical protein
MEKIKITSDNIEHYYNVINDKIDDYFKFHVSPISLLTYFSNNENLESFKIKNKLENIQNIDVVIKDVLNDRNNILKESIQPFELFKNTTDIDYIFTGIEKGNSKIEAILADFFELPLSKVNLKTAEKNIYTVNSNEYYCFDSDAILKIKNNIIVFIINELKKQRISIAFLKMEFDISEFVDVESLTKTLNDIVNNNHITQFLSLTNICKYVGTHKNCVIWSKK